MRTLTDARRVMIQSQSLGHLSCMYPPQYHQKNAPRTPASADKYERRCFASSGCPGLSTRRYPTFTWRLDFFLSMLPPECQAGPGFCLTPFCWVLFAYTRAWLSRRCDTGSGPANAANAATANLFCAKPLCQAGPDMRESHSLAPIMPEAGMCAAT